MKKQSYKKMFNVAIATTMAAGTVVAVAPTQADAAVSFSDVKETNTHYANIMSLAEREIIKGYEDGTYRSSNAVKRGHAAKIIAGVLGLNTKNVTNPNFKDVSTDNEYYGAIAALANAGIINGFKEDNTYRPSATLTRGQMAKIIANAFELTAGDTKNPFTDIEKSSYKEAILALYAAGVTTGKTATTYDATSKVTRGQLASFVVRAEAVTTPEPVDPTPTTVEDTFTISAVNGDKVVVAGEELEITEELKAVFNDENAGALEDSVVELVIEYTPQTVASVTPMFAKGKGKIVGLKKVKLVKKGTKFNPRGHNIPKVEVAATGITLANVKAENLEIAADAVVTLENAQITHLVVAENAVVTLTGGTVASVEITGDAKITVDADTILEKIVLEEGKTLADVIANYDEIKEQLKDLVVEEKPATTPVVPTPTPTPPTGDGDYTPPTPPADYITKLETNIGKLGTTLPGVATATVSGGNITINLLSGSYTVAEALDDAPTVVASLGNIGTATEVVSVKIGSTTFSSTPTPSNLQIGLAVAENFFGITGLELGKGNANEKLVELIPATTKTSTLTINFKNGSQKAYNVTVKK